MKLFTLRTLVPLSLVATCLAFGGAALNPPPTASAPRAPAPPDTITVKGSGSVTVNPDRVVLRASVEAHDEIAADAVDAFLAARERVFEGLGSLAGLELVGTGVQLTYGPKDDGDDRFGGMVVMGMGGDIEPPTPGAGFQEDFLLTLSGVAALDDEEKASALAELLDRAVDVGMRPAGQAGAQQQMVWLATQRSGDQASPALLTTRLDDEARAVAEDGAYAAALTDARRRAETLARLAGRTLGKVSSIELLETSGDWSRASSSSQLRAELSVVFELTR